MFSTGLLPLAQLPDGSSPAAAAPVIDKAKRKRIGLYFEKRYPEEFDRWHALRLSTRRRKLMLGALGIILLAAALAALIAGRLNYQSFVGREPIELGIAALALVTIIVALLLRTVEDMAPPAVVESEIDLAREHDVGALIANANRLLQLGSESAPPSNPMQSVFFKLVGYPSKKLSEELGFTISARPGTDDKVRINPVTVTAMKLGDAWLAIYEGTVDLTTGKMVTERLIEAAFRDIVTLERSSRGAKPENEKEPALLRMPRRKRQPRPNETFRDQDQLVIRFSDGQSASIMLRDASYETLKDAVVPLSSSHDEVEAFWKTLRGRWHATMQPQPAM